MRVIESKNFTADRSWGSLKIANMNGVTTSLHWTNTPYKWHKNEGEEVFVVLHGQVKMFYKKDQEEKSVILNNGDIFFASNGTEHVAHPVGEARILVVEIENSI